MKLIRRRKQDRIYQRVRGGRWAFDVRAWTAALRADEPHHHWLLAAPTYDEAAVECAQVVKELNTRRGGERVVRMSTTLTIDHLVPRFLADREEASDERRPERTQRELGYLKNVALYRFQDFQLHGVRVGDMTVRAITTMHVKQFLTTLKSATPPTAFDTTPADQRKKHAARPTHRGGLSPSSIHHHRFAVRLLFGYALEQGLVDANPVDGLVKRPRGTKRKPAGRALAGWECALLLHAAQRRPDFEPILATMIYCGLRLSEVRGLLVGDVLLDQQLLNVSDNPYRGIKSKPRQPPMAPALAELLGRVVSERRAAGATDGDLLFPSRKTGGLRSWRKVNEMVYRLAGVAKAHNHDYRRTFASHTLLLTQHGEPIAPTTVMRWIGHASLDLTINVYARDLPNEWHANRGASLDFAVARYQDMPGFAEKLAACDTRDMVSQPQ